MRSHKPLQCTSRPGRLIVNVNLLLDASCRPSLAGTAYCGLTRHCSTVEPIRDIFLSIPNHFIYLFIVYLPPFHQITVGKTGLNACARKTTGIGWMWANARRARECIPTKISTKMTVRMKESKLSSKWGAPRELEMRAYFQQSLARPSFTLFFFVFRTLRLPLSFTPPNHTFCVGNTRGASEILSERSGTTNVGARANPSLRLGDCTVSLVYSFHSFIRFALIAFPPNPVSQQIRSLSHHSRPLLSFAPSCFTRNPGHFRQQRSAHWQSQQHAPRIQTLASSPT